MHPSSVEKMKKFVSDNFKKNKKLEILDVGGLSTNGSYRNIFDTRLWNYTSLDEIDGPNVDTVAEDIYKWNQIADNSCDIVVSGQFLTSLDQPWKIFCEMYRVMKPGALCCVIVASAGEYGEGQKYHMTAQALSGMAEFVELDVIYAMTDNNGYWRDAILIAKKAGEVEEPVEVKDDLSEIADEIESQDEDAEA